MKNTDKAAALLRLLRGGDNTSPGLRVAEVTTSYPNPVTLIFVGTKLALDLGIFEIPVDCHPLRPGDRLLAFPIVGGAGSRWGVLANLNGGMTMATMQTSTSLKIDGLGAAHNAADLLIPPLTFTAGDRVSVAPIWDAGAKKIKYAIVQRY